MCAFACMCMWGWVGGFMSFVGGCTVFCPGFQKGRVPFENGTFSAVNGPSKGHNERGERNKKGTISAVHGRKMAHLAR